MGKASWRSRLERGSAMHKAINHVVFCLGEKDTRGCDCKPEWIAQYTPRHIASGYRIQQFLNQHEWVPISCEVPVMAKRIDLIAYSPTRKTAFIIDYKSGTSTSTRKRQNTKQVQDYMKMWNTSVNAAEKYNDNTGLFLKMGQIKEAFVVFPEHQRTPSWWFKVNDKR